MFAVSGRISLLVCLAPRLGAPETSHRLLCQTWLATCRIVGRPSWANACSNGDATEYSEEESIPVVGTAAIGPFVHDPFYRELFGSKFLEDAVLHMFCQAANLNGILSGDKWLTRW